MKIKLKNAFIYLLILFVALFVLSATDEADWNDGRCKCGGQWELTEIESNPKSVLTAYFYTCNNCDTIIRIHTAKHSE
jgi:hypothetical protein